MINILVIDDDESLFKILSSALPSDKFHLLTATTGESGLELLKTKTPAFIILDQILPDISGVEVLSKIKEDNNTAMIPVAILTSFMNEDIKQKAQQLGAVGYWLKYAIKMEDVARYIEDIIEKNHTVIASVPNNQ